MMANRACVAALLICLLLAGGALSQHLATAPATGSAILPEKLFEQTFRAVAEVSVFDGRNALMKQGTGFFVSTDGLLVTNAHVMAGGKAGAVELPAGRPLKVAGVVAASDEDDIVVLKVEADNLPFLRLSTAIPKQGQRVYAIGNPRGLTNTISDGLRSRDKIT